MWPAGLLRHPAAQHDIVTGYRGEEASFACCCRCCRRCCCCARLAYCYDCKFNKFYICVNLRMRVSHFVAFVLSLRWHSCRIAKHYHIDEQETIVELVPVCACVPIHWVRSLSALIQHSHNAFQNILHTLHERKNILFRCSHKRKTLFIPQDFSFVRLAFCCC